MVQERIARAFGKFEAGFAEHFGGHALQAKSELPDGTGVGITMDSQGLGIEQAWEMLKCEDNVDLMTWSSRDNPLNKQALPSFDGQLSTLEDELFGQALISASFQATLKEDIPEFAEILIQVVIHDQVPLDTRCFDLLVHHYAQRAATIRHMTHTQIVTTPEVEAVRSQIATAILDIWSSMKFLASQNQRKRIAAITRIHELIQSLMLYMTVGEEITIAPLITLVITEVASHHHRSYM